MRMILCTRNDDVNLKKIQLLFLVRIILFVEKIRAFLFGKFFKTFYWSNPLNFFD